MTIVLIGCQTAPKAPVNQKVESVQDVLSAVGTVAQGITNQPMTGQDIKNLAAQVQKDPQAQSALKAVNTSFNIQDTGVKYCPKDGKRFSSRLEYCPEHKVKLKPVE